MIKQGIVNILKPVADLFFDLVMSISMGAVRAVFIGMLVLIALWVIRLPKQFPEGGAYKLGQDLRLMAVGVLALQAILYILF